MFRSEALYRMGDIENALIGYEEALRDRKVFSRASRGVLQCLTALKSWQRVLTNISQWNMADEEAFPYRVKALQGLGRLEEAIEVCEQWVKTSPESKAALWAMVNLETERDGIEAVRRKYERLARIPSKAALYGQIYASLCKKSGNIEGALDQYSKLESRSNDPSILRRKVFALAKSGHEQEAIPMLEEMLRVDPNDFYLHSSYQGACRRAGELERAWSFYHALQSTHPDNMALLGRAKKIQKELERKHNSDSV